MLPGGLECAAHDDGRAGTSSLHAALDMASEGDVVVVCVDHANQVWKELQRRQHGAASETDGLRAVVGIPGSDDEVDLDL